MCFFDPRGFSMTEGSVSRRRFLGTGMAAGLAASALGVGRTLLTPGVAEGAETPSKAGGPGTSGVNFTWFGTNGWEIAFGNKTILMDPWFSRYDCGFFRGKFDPNFPNTSNEALIDQRVKKADQIVIGHGHWDHIGDIPYIAKKTGAQVIGSETHANVMRAAGVPEGKIVQVKGGEYMQFDGYTIEVFPGLHSMGPTKKHAVPGHLYSVPAAPAKVGDMPEGDSLIYMITIAEKYRIFLMSTANFVERAIAGLKPDVALVASIFANQIHDYTPRLFRALNHPKVVLPTHWDNFEKPYADGPEDLRAIFGDPANMDLAVKDVKRVSPKSKVVMLKFFESYAP